MRPGKTPLQRHTTRTINAALALLVLWVIVHAIRNRSLVDFLTYPTYIALVLVAGGFALIAKKLISSNGSQRRAIISGDLVPMVAGNLLLAVVYYSGYVAVVDFYGWMQRTDWTKDDSLKTAVFAAAALGVALFLFRLRLRFLYGLTEVLAGVAVVAERTLSAEKIGTALGVDFFLAILTAGIYLIVRGLDNVHQGLTRPQADLDPVAKRVVGWFGQAAAPGEDGPPDATRGAG